MKAAIVNPYLDTLGGGERYSLAFAKVLSSLGYQVDVEWQEKDIIRKLEERFGMELTEMGLIKDAKRGDGYDVCFWVSDGSIPALKARKNFLHFQVPFVGVNGRTLLNRMKLFRIRKIICNSDFTRDFIDREYGVESVVIYPPVSVEKIRPRRKKNKILFVGRFSQLTQAKNQNVLVRIFKKFSKRNPDWELVLAGGTEVGAGDYLEKLKKLSQGYPVRIVASPSFKELLTLYGQARFFWSAVGFGTKEKKEPEKVEHFGISVVEAMAGGTIPLVYSAGGHKEIVKDGKNGFLWKTEGELLRKTQALINDKGLYRFVYLNSLKSSQKFSYERFFEDVRKIL